METITALKIYFIGPRSIKKIYFTNLEMGLFILASVTAASKKPLISENKIVFVEKKIGLKMGCSASAQNGPKEFLLAGNISFN